MRVKVVACIAIGKRERSFYGGDCDIVCQSSCLYWCIMNALNHRHICTGVYMRLEG
jgi:hypothetical protein